MGRGLIELKRCGCGCGETVSVGAGGLVVICCLDDDGSCGGGNEACTVGRDVVDSVHLMGSNDVAMASIGGLAPRHGEDKHAVLPDHPHCRRRRSQGGARYSIRLSVHRKPCRPGWLGARRSPRTKGLAFS
jgi:hypothetical protein